MIKLAASLLAADFLKIGAEIQKAKDAGMDFLHVDVMDGMFVPNITFGQGILAAAAKQQILPCDVHLMITEPERYIAEFAAAGARIITVHAEATKHLQRALTMIHECGCLAGVALNPATSPDCLRYVLGDFDLALVMTVNPGFGGQKYLPQCAQKVGEIKAMLEKAHTQAMLEVDGGITLTTAPCVINEGANLLVTGSAFYRSEDPFKFVQSMKTL